MVNAVNRMCDHPVCSKHPSWKVARRRSSARYAPMREWSTSPKRTRRVANLGATDGHRTAWKVNERNLEGRPREGGDGIKAADVRGGDRPPAIDVADGCRGEAGKGPGVRTASLLPGASGARLVSSRREAKEQKRSAPARQAC